MQLDNFTIATLRDKIIENSRELKMLRKQSELANLLKALNQSKVHN